MNSRDIAVLPIGIFDSGFGGLTVMRSLIEELPCENIVYFGDTARLPYGEKSREDILLYTKEGLKFLEGLGVKLLFIACNTACTAALEELEGEFSIPILGMIDPGIQEIEKITGEGSIAILSTRATASSGIYGKKIQALFPEKKVISLPCPLFVPLIEEGYTQEPFVQEAVKETLRPLHKEKIGAAFLACTHYPLIKGVISKELGGQVSIIDPSSSCAKNVREELFKKGVLNLSKEPGKHQFFVSQGVDKFQQFGSRFLGRSVDIVKILPKYS